MASLGPLEVRRRALLAASKVSLSAVLLTGCGGRVEAPATEPLFTEGARDAAGDAESVDAALSETTVSADGGGACGRTVEAALSDAGDPAASTDPAVIACCREILPAWTFGDEGGVSYDAARACCMVIGGDKWWELGYPACTPWGPPMPPAFDDLEAKGGRVSTLDLREPARSVRPEVPNDPEARASAIATWRGRMLNEWGSSRVFAALAIQMRGAGMPKERVAAVEGFAEEERTHGVLCGAVVEALGGEARAELPECPPLPSHPGVDPELAVLRNVLSICCLSETVAVSLIAAERLEMPEGSLRDLLSRIWADEIGHARFGWSLLAELVPTLDAERLRALAAYVPHAIDHVVAHELAHLPDTHGAPPGGAALGLCAGAEARTLFFDTLEQVIKPRLSAFGLVH